MKATAKKIILTSNIAWNIANFRIPLIQALQQEGFDVVTAATFDMYAQKVKDCTRFIPLHFLRRGGMNPLLDIALLFEYIFLYKKEKPDMVLNFTIKPNIYSSLACRLLGIPAVSTVTGLGYAFSKKGLLQSLVRLLYKFALGKNTCVVFQNKENMDLFVQKSFISSDAAVLVEGSGVDTSQFSPTVCVQQNTNTITFLMVARLLRDKGVYEFVEAARKIRIEYPNVKCVLLGAIDDENPSAVSRYDLEDWESKGIIQYAGTTDDVRPYICNSDVVVLPSYHEGLSKSLLEAMAMSRPIIATDIPGCRPLVHVGVNGFLIPVGNTDALADVMKNCIEIGSEKLAAMGIKSRALVLEKFDQVIINDQYKNIIIEAIGN